MEKQRRSLNKRKQRTNNYKKYYNNKKEKQDVSTSPDLFDGINPFTEDFSKREMVIEDEKIEDTTTIRRTDSYNAIDDAEEKTKYNNLDDTKVNILDLDNIVSYEKMEKEEPVDTNKRIMIDIGKKHYFSFESRIIVLLILMVLSLVIVGILYYSFLTYEDNQEISYDNNGYVNYKLYLKDNTMMDRKELEDSRDAYFTDLLDKIDVNFEYDFLINRKTNINFKYNVVAEIVIKDIKEEKELYSDRFILASKQGLKINNDNNIVINETIKDIDYGYYQSIAYSYSSQLGEETKNYLNIYLEVFKENDKKERNYVLNETDRVGVLIPLSSDMVLAKITANDLAKKGQIDRIGFINTKRDIICIAGIFGVLAIYFALKIYNLIILLKDKKSVYDKYVSKLLNKYDKVIAESTTVIDLKKYDVIKIKNFDELLDIYDNLELPIIYCEVVKGEKCYFYIKNNKDVYLLQVKAVDLEEE